MIAALLRRRRERQEHCASCGERLGDDVVRTYRLRERVHPGCLAAADDDEWELSLW